MVLASRHSDGLGLPGADAWRQRRYRGPGPGARVGRPPAARAPGVRLRGPGLGQRLPHGERPARRRRARGRRPGRARLGLVRLGRVRLGRARLGRAQLGRVRAGRGPARRRSWAPDRPGAAPEPGRAAGPAENPPPWEICRGRASSQRPARAAGIRSPPRRRCRRSRRTRPPGPAARVDRLQDEVGADPGAPGTVAIPGSRMLGGRARPAAWPRWRSAGCRYGRTPPPRPSRETCSALPTGR